jgi:(S)-ureidoglycine aminohydrolase
MKHIFLLSALLYSAILIAQQKDSLLSRVYHWDELVVTKEENRLRRQMMEGPTTMLSYFEVHTSTLEPGKAPHPPHKHEDMEELIIVKEGQVTVTIGDSTKTFGAGSVAMAMPPAMHGINNSGKTNATYYILKFKSRLPTNFERAQQKGGSFLLNWDNIVFTKTEKGGRRNFFDRGTSQLENFEMHTTMLNPGLSSHAPHTHAQEEIVLLLKGHVEMEIDGKRYKAGAGDIIFLASNIPHALHNTGNEPCEYFAFQWKN